jgi:predicted nucleic acid-binding protein
MPKVRVVLDTDVLVSLCKVGAVGLLDNWPSADYCITDVTMFELTKPDSMTCVNAALANGTIRLLMLNDASRIEEFAQLAPRVGPGEAAMIVMARQEGGIGMSNDRRAAKVAQAQSEPATVVTVDDLFARCIAAGRISSGDFVKLQSKLRTLGEFVPLRNGIPTSLTSPLPALPPVVA